MRAIFIKLQQVGNKGKFRLHMHADDGRLGSTPLQKFPTNFPGLLQVIIRASSVARARLFFPPGMELPPDSLAARGAISTAAEGEHLPTGVWANRPVREVTIFADRYEMTISLLMFEGLSFMPMDWIEEEVEDTFDRFMQSR